MDMTHRASQGIASRSSNGCWTCRLRRKKCDETRPVCNVCLALRITCNYDQEKPKWMDGGQMQEAQAERLRREVKEKASRRREERAVQLSSNRECLHQASSNLSPFVCGLQNTESRRPSGDPEPCPKICQEGSLLWHQNWSEGQGAERNSQASKEFGQSDSILFMFYLEHLLPFLFPFYSPPLVQGGRAWFLDMMISSPVVREATLCQSGYFFSLMRQSANHQAGWDCVLKQTAEAFDMLRKSLVYIDGPDIQNHLHGAVRVMTSIMQLQRFEIAILSFNHCQAHLNAALAIFKKLMEGVGTVEAEGPTARFFTLLTALGPTSWILPTQDLRIPSSEQSGFRFSSAILILDDIIASTVLQEEPRLYEYHRFLLECADGSDVPIDMEATVGCQNWVLVQIGEIAALDAWKQRCKNAGDLDVMELVRRASTIKNSLDARFKVLESQPVAAQTEGTSIIHAFTSDYCQPPRMSHKQTLYSSYIWAHAAFLYLSMVVSGWQPARVDVRHHVARIIDLLAHHISPPTLLRTLVWPFCVAGCLAEPMQEQHIRGLAERLRPSEMFGTVGKAIEVMENVWSSRDIPDAANRDLAACFQSPGELILLV